MGTKKLNDSEILSQLLKEINYSAHKFANKMGYASASSIYHILKGTNKISSAMADKIVDALPGVNYLFVTRGELPILLDNSETIGQSNILGLSKKVSFDDVPQTLKNIENLLVQVLEKLSEK